LKGPEVTHPPPVEAGRYAQGTSCGTLRGGASQISDLCHGPGSLVSFYYILVAWRVVLDIFSSACAAVMVKTSSIVNYGKTRGFLLDSANLTIWVV
jgi:hypothetical protein